MLLALAILLAGCTTVGPNYQPPEQIQLPEQWSEEDAVAQSVQVGAWWMQFNDPVLNQLIEQGARQNLTIAAAGLRIVQARAALGISDALIFPQEQQVNGNFSGLYRNEDWFKSAGASLDVGWEMDVWGKYARGIESSEASLYASIASYHDVLVSISAEIARNYINYRTAQERMFLSRQNIAIQRRVVEMTQIQFDSGNVSELDVQQAKAQLFATQSALPTLNIARLQAQNAIAVLLGTIPEEVESLLLAGSEREIPDLNNRIRETQVSGAAGADYTKYSVIPHAPQLKGPVDAQTVMRRPDLQVAELQARAQSARIGLTEADLYPQFVLFGSLGVSQTVRSSNSFDLSDAVTATIGPGLSWNIFNYGRIKDRVRIEDALFQESLTNYNQTVLDAVREVTNAIDGYYNNVEKSKYDFGAVQASIRAFNISFNQYNNGLVSYQRLLSTVETMTLREDAYAQTRGNIANQVVGLYKALGGGWEPFQALPVVNPETVRQMESRTDWGDYLQPQVINGEDRNE
ncbi:Outer membrane protein OprM [Halioglobus japonicus]|nr:Outer membrane protein OprM [Halioglobus japonicus]